MKKTILIAILSIFTLVGFSQPGFKANIGGTQANSDFGAFTEVAFVANFVPKQSYNNLEHEVITGLLHSPVDNKTIYKIGYGVVLNRITLSLGGALVVQKLTLQNSGINVHQRRAATVGAEYYLTRKSKLLPNFYVGADYIDEGFYLKIGTKFLGERWKK